MGSSTYDVMHAPGSWCHRWGTLCEEPPTLRELRDHKNVDPRDNWVPKDPRLQNQKYR